MSNIIPLAAPKLLDFSPPPVVAIQASGIKVIPESIFIKIVGKANVDHLQWVIGNYWEQKIANLDTDALFNELRILFRSKRKAKRTMNETREEIAERTIAHDWNKIWSTFCKKVDRALWRNPKAGTVQSQTVQLHMADLVIEESSTCEVQFRGTGYTVGVEGRRSVIGKFSAIKGSRVRIMNIKNRFVGRTFWQCQGRSSVVAHQPGLFDECE